MGMFDNMFAPAAPATPVTPGNLPDGSATPAPATPGTAANGAVPAAAPAEPATPDSPLDEFKTLWEDLPTDPNAAPDTPTVLDPAKLKEVITKADFTQVITPENLTAIAAGGEEAQAAFTASMNAVAQQVLLQATLAGNKMTEQAVAAAIAKQTESIPELIRTQSLSNNLVKANPIFSNPAAKPIMEALQSQLAVKNPTATPDELATMTQEFVVALGQQLVPAPEATPEGEVSLDWSKFA